MLSTYSYYLLTTYGHLAIYDSIWLCAFLGIQRYWKLDCSHCNRSSQSGSIRATRQLTPHAPTLILCLMISSMWAVNWMPQSCSLPVNCSPKGWEALAGWLDNLLRHTPLLYAFQTGVVILMARHIIVWIGPANFYTLVDAILDCWKFRSCFPRRFTTVINGTHDEEECNLTTPSQLGMAAFDAKISLWNIGRNYQVGALCLLNLAWVISPPHIIWGVQDLGLARPSPPLALIGCVVLYTLDALLTTIEASIFILYAKPQHWNWYLDFIPELSYGKLGDHEVNINKVKTEGEKKYTENLSI